MSKNIPIVAIAFLGVALGFLNVSASAEDKKTDLTIGKMAKSILTLPSEQEGHC